ncbi:MAG: ribosomal L7Ae/L30e/S12e/Gadd45 family protein [Clostridia bacterium]|nr:ribosomal L7Ae/L30e/S12e/Gadd45 family protein [Clostridia bacterium]
MKAEKNSPLQKLKMTIGLAAKAGKAVFGTPLICESLRMNGAKKCVLVLEGSDTSENTHKKLTDKCAFYETELIRLPISMAELSEAVGKRSQLSAVGIRDEGLARAVMAKIKELPPLS